MARRRPRRRLFALLALLLLLLLWKLNPFLAGVLPGGGRWFDEPEPDLAPGAIEVLVVSREARAPVAGATVHLAGLRGVDATRKTDAKGRARFEGLAAEPIRIEAEGRGGFASAWSRPGARVEVRLAPKPTRTGRVRDAAGNAVAATVHLLDKEARILASAATGDDGRYELPDEPDGVAVCAWPTRGAPAASTDGDIVVSEGVRHAGEAADAGRGEIEIFAMVPDSTEDRMVPLRVRWKLDGEGRYEGRLPEDAQAYVFEGPYATPLGEAHAIAFLALSKGRLVDEEGRPVAGATVRARAMSHGLPVSPNPFPIEKTSDANGAFDLGWGPSTRYELEISAPGRARIVVPAPREDEAILLPRGFRLGGRVVDEDDRPVPGARVDALPTPDPDARFVEARAVTADDGKFWVDGVGGEYARVRVRKDGYRPATMDRVPPEGFVTIRLRRE